MAAALEDYIGHRFYNTELDETFTVVGHDNILVWMQYDDGTAWDEGVSELDMSEGAKGHLGLSEELSESPKYVHRGCGPKREHFCDEGKHDWYPLPDELGWDLPDEWNAEAAYTYERIVRCKRCGVSGNLAANYDGCDIPSVCHHCGRVVAQDEDMNFADGDILVCNNCHQSGGDS